MPESHTPVYSKEGDAGIFRHFPFAKWRKTRNDKIGIEMFCIIEEVPPFTKNTSFSITICVTVQYPTRHREERSDDAISLFYLQRDRRAPTLRRLLAMTGKISSNGNN